MAGKIVILFNPFHLRQLEKVAGDFQPFDQQSIFFYSLHIDRKEIEENFKNSQTIEIPHFYFRYKDFLNSPVKKLIRYRREIKKLRAFIKNKIDGLGTGDDIELIYFNEKSIFSQLMILHVKKKFRNVKLVAIDEGAAFYVEDKLKDKVFKLLYYISTPLLLGFDYKYVGAAGINSDLDIIYVRFPDLVQKKVRKATYRIIPNNVLHNGKSLTKKNNVLIITSPLSEARFLRTAEEKEIMKNVFEIFTKCGYNVDIKLHPSEDLEKYSFVTDKNIRFLDKSSVAENLDYFAYKYILNFGSSVVLDILASGYPEQNVLTYSFVKATNSINWFTKTTLIKNIKDLFEFIKLQ